MKLIDKDVLVAEIDRRLHQLTDAAFDSMIGRNLIEIKDFLDTLDVKEMKEEPVSEDLEEAVNVYIGHKPDVDEGSSVYGKRQAFKAGAQWKKERLIDRACEWLQEQEEFIGISFQEDFIERFKEAMED